MSEDSVNLVAWLLKNYDRLPMKLIFAIASAFGVLPFVSKDLLPTPVAAFAEWAQHWLVLVLLLCLTLVLAWLFGFIAKAYALVNTRVVRPVELPPETPPTPTLERRLSSLTADEKETLRTYLERDRRTLIFPMSSGTVNILERDGILRRATAISVSLDRFHYELVEEARQILLKDPSVLKP